MLGLVLETPLDICQANGSGLFVARLISLSLPENQTVL
jgi:hypothetical protein